MFCCGSATRSGSEIAHGMFNRIVDDLRQPLIGDRRRRLRIAERDPVDHVDMVDAVGRCGNHDRLRGADLRGRRGDAMTVAVDGERQVVVGRAVDEADRNLHAAGSDLPQQPGQIDLDLNAIAADRDALGHLGGARSVASAPCRSRVPAYRRAAGRQWNRQRVVGERRERRMRRVPERARASATRWAADRVIRTSSLLGNVWATL